MPGHPMKGSEGFNAYLRANPPMAVATPPAPVAALAQRAAPFFPAPTPGTIVQVPAPGQGGRYRGYQAGTDVIHNIAGDFGSSGVTDYLDELLPGGAGTAAANAVGGNVGATKSIIGGALEGDLGGAVSGVASAGGGAAGKAAGTAIGTAFGGPLGGAIGGALGSAAGSKLGQAAGDLVGGGAKQDIDFFKDGTKKVPAPLMGYAEGKFEAVDGAYPIENYSDHIEYKSKPKEKKWTGTLIGGSKHYVPGEYNEKNLGLGIESPGGWGVLGYDNSFNNPSLYAYKRFNPWESKSGRFGLDATVGIQHGYTPENLAGAKHADQVGKFFLGDKTSPGATLNPYIQFGKNKDWRLETPLLPGAVGFTLRKKFKDGTDTVEDNYFAKEEARKAALTPEERQMEWIDLHLKEPLEQKLEAAPKYVQAPLALAAAAKEFDEGDLRLGKFGGGKLYGGREGIRFEHGKYGDFEVGPDRVGWKKTWRW